MKIGIKTIRGINKRYGCADDIMPEGIDALVEKVGAQLGAVEEVIDLGKKYKGIVVAKVVSCVKHPNADKLHVCKVDDGGVVKNITRDNDGLVQVVCGAPNVREGLLVAWLPPGTTVPNSFDKDPFVLESREIRGEISNGMLASAHELSISDNHDGILELDETARPGDDFAQVYGLDDYIIDIENKMFTHRPDCFGFLGVARELAGIQQMSFKSPDWYQVEPKFPKIETDETAFKLSNTLPKLVPRFTAITLSDIKVNQSPLWLQVELAKVGSRAINNIVDYTNFFMLETGQPLHAYDYDKLAKLAGGNTPSLETRLSKNGEKLKLLNGKEVTFEDDSTVLITSNDLPVGIGGVMGGADTEVDENTKKIVLECANFDMYNIRRTSMKYGLFTDAVTRFNKGQSPKQNLAVLANIVDEICQFAGGKVSSKVMDDDHTNKNPIIVRVSAKFVNERLGVELDPDEIHKLLANVEFQIERTDNLDELKITPPFWRTDIEIPEDIVEEVGRLYGYDHLPLELPRRDLTPAKKDELLTLKQSIREILAKAGANELLTYSFVHGNLIDKAGQDREKAFKLSNALSPDLQFYRLSLTPSLLDKIHPNIKAGFGGFALFELGKAHIKGENDTNEPDVPKEVNALSFVLAADNKTSQSYTGSPYYQARKYLDTLTGCFGVESFIELESLASADLYNNPWIEQMVAPFEPTRSAILRDTKGVLPGTKGLIWGVLGEYKRSVIQALKLPKFAAGFELDPLLFTASQVTSYKPLPKFPKVQQDITIKTPSSILFKDLQDFLISNLNSPDNTQVTLQPLDIYQGEDKTTKNITFRLTIASYERTLTDKEINKLLDKLAIKVEDHLNAERI